MLEFADEPLAHYAVAYEPDHRRRITIEGLAGSLLFRDWGKEPTWVEFTMVGAAREYHAVIEDHDPFCRDHGLKPPPAEECYQALVTVKKPDIRQSQFLPLRRENHASLDAALVATVYAVLRHGDWSVDLWRQELMVTLREAQVRAARRAVTRQTTVLERIGRPSCC